MISSMTWTGTVLRFLDEEKTEEQRAKAAGAPAKAKIYNYDPLQINYFSRYRRWSPLPGRHAEAGGSLILGGGKENSRADFLGKKMAVLSGRKMAEMNSRKKQNSTFPAQCNRVTPLARSLSP